MHMVNCEHPKYVFNKYIKEWVRVRCGKCNSCMMSHAAEWVSRIDLENVCHKYCFMVTLTYDDEHIPALFFNDDMDSLVCNRDESVCIPLSDFYDKIYQNRDDKVIQKELDYLSGRLVHPLGLPIIWKKDISDFFKRLNQYTYNHVTSTYENYRMFCAHEYGPTTFRPHAHLLVWFEDDRIAKDFTSLVRTNWTFGRVDASAIFSDGGRSYVAQYVNMSCHLPSFYLLRRLAPSHQESKQPPIGCDVILDSQIRQIYDRIPVKRNCLQPKTGEYVCLPLSPSVRNRFFPKLQGHCDWSYSDRVGIYGAFQAFYRRFKIREFTTFLAYVSSLVETQDWISLGYGERCVLNYYMFLKSRSDNPDSLVNSVRRWFFISQRVCYYSSLLNVRVAWLVSRIDEFWKKFDYESLVSFYKFQEDYAKDYPFTHLVVMYPDFYRLLPRYVEFPEKQDFYIQGALLTFDIYDKDDIPDFRKLPDFLSMKGQALTIYKDTHKRMFCNQYRDKKLSVSDSQLYSILKDYNS